MSGRSSGFTRRDFLKAAAVAAPLVITRPAIAGDASDRINAAVIGEQRHIDTQTLIAADHGEDRLAIELEQVRRRFLDPGVDELMVGALGRREEGPDR